MFLFIKTSSLGDIIQSFPALGFLRKKFPQARIDWVVEAPFAELVRSHPAVNTVFTIESKQWRKGRGLKNLGGFFKELRRVDYDVAFDLQSNLKSSGVLAATRARRKVGFGWKTAHEWPSCFFTNFKANPPPGLNIREDYLYILQRYFNDFSPFTETEIQLTLSEAARAQVDTLLKSLPSSKKVLVAPKTAWPNKELSVTSLIRVLQKEEGFFLFTWGRKEEKGVAEELQKAFKDRSAVLDPLPLAELQYLMGRVDLVLAMDSLPLHLAGTTKTATQSFFGPTCATKFKPLGQRHQSTQGSCPYGISFEKQCPRLRSCKTGACLKNLME